MKKRKAARLKRERGKTLMLTLPQEMEDWLVEHTKKRGASSVQETVRQLLAAAKSEQEQQAA